MDAPKWFSVHLLCMLLVLAAATVVFGVTAAPEKAPDFTLKSLSGKNLKLSEMRGRVVLINFWATWCAPCKEELPFFNRLYSKFRGTGLEILAVNVDKTSQNAADFSRRLKLEFPVLLDPAGKVSDTYRITSMPSTIVVAKDGTVRFVHRGFLPTDPDRYDEEIRSLLKE